MAFANTSLVQLRRIKEATFGVLPVTGNAMNLRVTGESFNFDIKKEESKELRDDRQIGYVVPVSAGAMGGFNFHLNYGEYDPEIESVLQSTWGVYGTNGEGTAFTATFTATTIAPAVDPSTTSAFTNLVRGQWFRLVAPTHANDGKFFKVSSTVTPTTSLITVDASTPLAVGSGIANCKLQTSRISNGIIQSSYSYEKQAPDVVQFFTYLGMTPGKMNLKFAAAAISEGSFEFMGKSASRGVVTTMPGTAAASRTYEIQSGATLNGQLWEAGVPLASTFIKSLDLSIDNVQRAQEAILNFGYVGIGSGTLRVTANMEVYFANGALYDKFLANTYTSLVVGSQDPAGNGYIMTLPRVNLKSAKIVAGSKDQDLMASFEVQALSDDANAIPALRKTIFFDRVGAALPPL
jgi:hypothetical protein